MKGVIFLYVRISSAIIMAKVAGWLSFKPFYVTIFLYCCHLQIKSEKHGRQNAQLKRDFKRERDREKKLILTGKVIQFVRDFLKAMKHRLY